MPALTPGGVPLVVIQMLGGLPPLADLYRSVRRDNAAERVLLCMVPGIFMVTAANVVIAAIGVVCLACALFQPDYRRVLSRGKSEEMLSQLHRELAEQEPLLKETQSKTNQG